MPFEPLRVGSGGLAVGARAGPEPGHHPVRGHPLDLGVVSAREGDPRGAQEVLLEAIAVYEADEHAVNLLSLWRRSAALSRSRAPSMRLPLRAGSFRGGAARAGPCEQPACPPGGPAQLAALRLRRRGALRSRQDPRNRRSGRRGSPGTAGRHVMIFVAAIAWSSISA